MTDVINFCNSYQNYLPDWVNFYQPGYFTFNGVFFKNGWEYDEAHVAAAYNSLPQAVKDGDQWLMMNAESDGGALIRLDYTQYPLDAVNQRVGVASWFTNNQPQVKRLFYKMPETFGLGVYNPDTNMETYAEREVAFRAVSAHLTNCCIGAYWRWPKSDGTSPLNEWAEELDAEVFAAEYIHEKEPIITLWHRCNSTDGDKLLLLPEVFEAQIDYIATKHPGVRIAWWAWADDVSGVPWWVTYHLREFSKINATYKTLA